MPRLYNIGPYHSLPQLKMITSRRDFRHSAVIRVAIGSHQQGGCIKAICVYQWMPGHIRFNQASSGRLVRVAQMGLSAGLYITACMSTHIEHTVALSAQAYLPTHSHLHPHTHSLHTHTPTHTHPTHPTHTHTHTHTHWRFCSTNNTYK